MGGRRRSNKTQVRRWGWIWRRASLPIDLARNVVCGEICVGVLIGFASLTKADWLGLTHFSIVRLL